MLYLPVEVAGALFSVGDTHAAQGDGEVCGTAIESPMNVVLTLDLVKDARLKTPRFTTPGPVTRHLDAKGYEVTTGIGPDLMEGASERGRADGRPARRAATASTPVDAYMLVLGLRRSADQRDRRHAELGGVVLLPALRLRMTRSGGRRTVRGRPGRRSHRRAGARRLRPRRLRARRGRRARRSSRTSPSPGARRDALHRRRIRLRQVDDGAGDHAAPAAAGGAHRRRLDPARRRRARRARRKPRCGASAATASP